MIQKEQKFTPKGTPRERQDSWILYKIKQEMWSVGRAAKDSSVFAEALAKWKKNEISKADFLPIARKYVYCPPLGEMD